MLRRLKQVILLGGDISLLYLSLYLALLIRYPALFSFETFTLHVPPFSIIYALWVLVFFTFGLYSMRLIWNISKAVRPFAWAMVVNTVLSVFFFYLVPYFSVTPKRILLFVLVIFSVFFVLWRLFYSRVLRIMGTSTKVVLVGVSNASLELARNLRDHPELGYKVVSLFDLSKKPIPAWLKKSVPLIGHDLTWLESAIRGRAVDIVVVSNELYPHVFAELYNLLPTGVDFYNISSFWEGLDRSIPVSEADEAWFLDNLRGVRKSFYESRKRVLDLVLAVGVGLMVLLISPLIVLGIKLTDRGPVLYRQKRVGRGGEEFEMIKFRTMVQDAEKGRARWSERGDPRITKLGKLLRVSRLDEFPNVINVFKGQMSFFGPRPERPEFVRKLERRIPHYNLRHIIRPGLTGWAQVNCPYGSSVQDAERKLRYDLYYLKNRSLLLDLEIFFKTIAVVVFRKGR